MVSGVPSAVSLLTIATVDGKGAISRRSDVPLERDDDEGSALADEDDFDFSPDSDLEREEEDGLEDEPERLLLDGLEDDIVARRVESSVDRIRQLDSSLDR
jgi:hypothetical protein